MITTTHTEESLIEMRVEGKVTHEDYEKLTPQMDEIIERHGKLDCLIEMKGVKSIEPKAILDDLKFDVRHAGDFNKVALVTDKTWHELATKLWSVFFPKAKVKCFDHDERDAAEKWVRE